SPSAGFDRPIPDLTGGRRSGESLFEMSERFFRYDVTELRTMGARLIEAIAGSPRLLSLASDSDVWTELCLDWLAGAAAERARVDSAPPRPALTAEIYAEVEWAAPRSVVRQGPTSMSHLGAP